MRFEPRISLVTLGVADVARSRRFYEALGFTASRASQDGVAFMAAGGTVLSLYGRSALAADTGLADDGRAGFRAVTLAYNCRSEAEVDSALAHAVACGAVLQKPAHKIFWGGYVGFFADPDGHLWEVAYNPFFPLDATGRLELP